MSTRLDRLRQIVEGGDPLPIGGEAPQSDRLSRLRRIVSSAPEESTAPPLTAGFSDIGAGVAIDSPEISRRREILPEPALPEPERWEGAGAGGSWGAPLPEPELSTPDVRELQDRMRLAARHRAAPGGPSGGGGFAIAPPDMAEQQDLEKAAAVRQETQEAAEYARSLTPGQRLENAANSFAQGVVGIPAGMLEGIAVIAKELDEHTFDQYEGEGAGDLATARVGQRLQAWAQKAFPTDPKLQRAFLESVVPQAFGSAASFMATGIAGRGLASAGGATQAGLRATGAVTSGSVGALAEAGGTYREAIGEGASEELARRSGLAALPLGAIEALPAERALNRAVDALRKRGGFRAIAGAAAAGSLEEAGQEGLQGFGGNVIARLGFDPDRELTEDVLVNMLAGAVVGGVMGGGVTAIGNTAGGVGEDERQERLKPVLRAMLAPENDAEGTVAGLQEAFAQGIDMTGRPLTEGRSQEMLQQLQEASEALRADRGDTGAQAIQFEQGGRAGRLPEPGRDPLAEPAFMRRGASVQKERVSDGVERLSLVPPETAAGASSAPEAPTGLPEPGIAPQAPTEAAQEGVDIDALAQQLLRLDRGELDEGGQRSLMAEVQRAGPEVERAVMARADELAATESPIAEPATPRPFEKLSDEQLRDRYLKNVRLAFAAGAEGRRSRQEADAQSFKTGQRVGTARAETFRARGMTSQAETRAAAYEAELKARGIALPDPDEAFTGATAEDFPATVRAAYEQAAEGLDVEALADDDLLARLAAAEGDARERMSDPVAAVRRAILSGERIRRGLEPMAATAPEAETTAETPEHVRAAAVRIGDQVFEGPMHDLAREEAAKAGVDPDALEFDVEEGYVTSTGRFIDQVEARPVGAAAGQIPLRNGEPVGSEEFGFGENLTEEQEEIVRATPRGGFTEAVEMEQEMEAEAAAEPELDDEQRAEQQARLDEQVVERRREGMRLESRGAVGSREWTERIATRRPGDITVEDAGDGRFTIMEDGEALATVRADHQGDIGTLEVQGFESVFGEDPADASLERTLREKMDAHIGAARTSRALRALREQFPGSQVFMADESGGTAAPQEETSRETQVLQFPTPALPGEQVEGVPEPTDAMEVQDNLFGGPGEVVAGEEQRGLGLPEPGPTLEREERVARQTVDRLKPKVDAGRATPAEQEAYREALALIRRGQGLNEEEVRIRARQLDAVQEPDDTGDLFGDVGPEAKVATEPTLPAGFLTREQAMGRVLEREGPGAIFDGESTETGKLMDEDRRDSGRAVGASAVVIGGRMYVAPGAGNHSDAVAQAAYENGLVTRDAEHMVAIEAGLERWGDEIVYGYAAPEAETDVAEMADVAPDTETAAPPAPPAGPREVEVGGRTFRPIPSVEIARIATRLLGGSKVFVKKYPRARGMFYADAADPRIGLNPELGRDYDQAARTLSHEIGHLVDFLEDRTMARGNVLGRIASLKGYLSTTIDAEPTDPSKALTPADRKKIRRSAEKQVGPRPPKDEEADLAAWREEVGRVYGEMIAEEVDARGLLTEDLIREELIALSDHWRPGMFEGGPGFLAYRMSGPELYADALSALLVDPATMQEKAPAFMDAFVAYMGRKPEVARTYEDIQDLLAGGEDAVYAERSAEVVGDFHEGDEKMLAAADPQKPKQPISNHLHQTYLSRASPVTGAEREKLAGKKGFRARAGLLSEAGAAEMALEELRHRDNRTYGLIEDVEQTVGAPMVEAGISTDDAGLYLMMSRIAAGDRGGVAEMAKQAIRDITGEQDWDAARAAYIQMLENDPAEVDAVLLENAEGGMLPPELVKRAKDAGGLLAEALKGTLNPHMHTPETATEMLAGLEKRLGAEKYETLEKLMAIFRDRLHQEVREATEEQVYSRDFFENTAEPNKETYVPYAVLDYFNGTMSAGIRQQVGTVKGVANPFNAALYKAMALGRAIEYQKAKRALLASVTETMPDAVGEEQVIDKFHREKPAPQGMENLFYYVDGKLRYRAIDAHIAKVLQNSDLGSMQRTANISRLSYRIFHPLFVKYNPGFQLFNPIRDFKRTQRALTAVTRQDSESELEKVIGALMDIFIVGAEYAKVTPAAIRGAMNRPDPLIREMRDTRALGRRLFTSGARAGATKEGTSRLQRLKDWAMGPEEMVDGPYERMVEEYVGHRIGEASPKGWKARGKLVLDVIEAVTTYTEIVSKAAGYSLAKKRGLEGEQLAHFVRTYVGTPDSTERGLASDLSNGIFMYFNVIAAGMRADARLAGRPKTAAGYWTSATVADVMPKLIMAAAVLGLLDDELEEWFRHVPTYDKAKYIIIPIPWKPYTVDREGNRKAAYIRIPHDDFVRNFAGTFWAAISDDPNRFSRMLGTASGELPGLNPAFDMLLQGFQVAGGRNPYDSFRGRNVIPKRQWDAGDKERFKAFLQHARRQFGVASDFSEVLFRTPDHAAETIGQAVLRDIPGISRMIKVSDRGLSEQADRELALEQQARAQVKADVSRTVWRATGRRNHLNRLGVERLDDEDKALRDRLNAWYRDYYLPRLDEMERARDAGDDALYEDAKKRLEASITPNGWPFRAD